MGRYSTMSRVSAFIFVKATLHQHGNTLLSAAVFSESALRRHAAIRATLTRIKADMALVLMDYLSQQSFKSSLNGFSQCAIKIGSCSLVGRQVALCCLSLLTFMSCFNVVIKVKDKRLNKTFVLHIRCQ